MANKPEGASAAQHDLESGPRRELADPELHIWDQVTELAETDTDTESAAELAPASPGRWLGIREAEGVSDDDPDSDVLEAEQTAAKAYMATMVDRWVGWIALVTGLLSMLIAPVWMGSAAVAIGLFAYWMGRRAMGGWAIALGLLAIVTAVWIMPLYAS